MASLARITLNAEAAEAEERLEAADARLEAAGVERLTLDPDRGRATSLGELGRALLPRAQRMAEGTAMALAEGLAATADAIREHFPGNLLWDLDALAAALLREAGASGERAPRELAGAFDEVLDLLALFGRATPIRFRYVHDFVYGFDWAKWVRRAPDDRRGVGPYDRVFLRSMLRRGGELLELIEADDAKYPRLTDERPRNPFVFSREPAHELRLHRDLAARGLVPVQAWRLDPTPTWDRPFADERKERALALSHEGTAPPTS